MLQPLSGSYTLSPATSRLTKARLPISGQPGVSGGSSNSARGLGDTTINVGPAFPFSVLLEHFGCRFRFDVMCNDPMPRFVERGAVRVFQNSRENWVPRSFPLSQFSCGNHHPLDLHAVAGNAKAVQEAIASIIGQVRADDR